VYADSGCGGEGKLLAVQHGGSFLGVPPLLTDWLYGQ
jgi:hypothetical protein